MLPFPYPKQNDRNFLVPESMLDPKQLSQSLVQDQLPPVTQDQPIQIKDTAAYAVPKTTIDPLSYLSLNPVTGLQYPGISPAGFRMEQAGLKAAGDTAAAAQGQLGREQADIAQQGLREQQNLNRKAIDTEYDYKRKAAEFEDQLDEAAKAYPSLSRQQVVQTYSTAHKIASGIGILLGGIAQGLLRTPTNQVLDQFNKNVDSVIEANEKNFQKQYQAITSKQQKSYQDFQVARQMLDDNSRMLTNTMNALGQQAQAHYMTATSPIQKYIALQAIGKVQQQLDGIRWNTAVQQFGLEGQQRAWAATQMINPLNVVVGIDPKTNNNINAQANSKESADYIRENLPKIDAKINATKALVDYINNVNSIHEDPFKGQNLKNYKTLLEKQYGLKEGELADPLPVVGRNATDFYQNSIGQLQLERQALIRENTRQAPFAIKGK